MRITMVALILTVLFLGLLNQLQQPSADVIEHARMNLAARLPVPLDAVEYVDTEQVVWPNGCLGLYRPHQICPPGSTSGWRIHLRVDGRDYFYHAIETDVIYVGQAVV